MPIPEVPNIRSDRLNFNSTNEIPRVGTNGPSIIPTINPPVIENTPPPVIRGLELPVFHAPDTRIPYPVIQVPTQEEFDAAVKADKEKEQQQKEEKKRGLPDAPPILPAIKVPQQQEDKTETTTPTTQLTTDKPVTAEIQVPILGAVPIPTNKEVALAGTTAMAATAAALLGKSAVEFLLKFFKPIANQIWIRGKKLLSKDLTDYELQLFFAFEKEKELKAVAKKLKKEFKVEKQRQYKLSKEKK